jgi:mxaK protein
MNKTAQISYWSLVIATVMSAGFAIVKTIELIKVTNMNDFIKQTEQYEETPNTASALLARAYQQVEANQTSEALDTLTHAIARDDAIINKAALMNRANINLRQALTLDHEDKKRIPITELAKQDYRRSLLLDPEQWDVRYNLEIALSVVPEKPEEDVIFEKPSVLRQRTVESKGFKVDLP